ncbi:IclR family transcriptional regulator [Kineococcus sp. SYSU DK003]|uniref:IclR family transcriptional regulator n=1 Tax=Kineococcus sp. SYSU DK003 TaxID=3383124 RepID=UPI003D7CE2A9
MPEPARRPAPMKLLGNAQQVISLLAAHGSASPAEIAEQLGMPRSSVYRLIDGLAAINLVQIDEDGQAHLHLKWLHLADAARDAMSEWSNARDVLIELSEATGQTAFLSLPRGDEAICVDWSPGRGIGVLILRPGGSLPLHAGGAGRTVLSFGIDDVAAALARTERRRLTPWTMTTEAELLADVTTNRRQGFVHSDQDVTVGIGAVAVPLTDDHGQLLGCLSLAGLATDITARRQELVQALREAAPRTLSSAPPAIPIASPASPASSMSIPPTASPSRTGRQER